MKILGKTDFWLGITILTSGIWVFNQSRGFDETSKSYPLFLSIITILLGAGIAIQTVKQKDEGKNSIEWLFHRMRGSLLIVGLFVVWTILLSTTTGYLLASILTLMPVLYLLGYKKISHLVLSTFGIVAVVFTLFYLIFEVPLPLNPFVQIVLDLLS